MHWGAPKPSPAPALHAIRKRDRCHPYGLGGEESQGAMSGRDPSVIHRLSLVSSFSAKKNQDLLKVVVSVSRCCTAFVILRGFCKSGGEKRDVESCGRITARHQKVRKTPMQPLLYVLLAAPSATAFFTSTLRLPIVVQRVSPPACQFGTGNVTCAPCFASGHPFVLPLFVQ